MALQAAMELAKRFHLEKMGERPDLSSSLAIYNFLHPIIGNLDHEQAHLLLMNQNFKLIKDVKISEGGLTETAVDIRMIIREINSTTVKLSKPLL
jgi:DNA repair protein RadC